MPGIISGLRWALWFYSTSLLVGLWIGCILGCSQALVDRQPWTVAVFVLFFVVGHRASMRLLRWLAPPPRLGTRRDAP